MIEQSTGSFPMSLQKSLTQKRYDLTSLEQQMAQGEWQKLYFPVINRSPTFSEAFIAYLFDSLGVEYVREYVIGRYPIDFFLPHINLCLDVDSPCFRGKGGRKSKKKKGDIKEDYLRSLHYEFFRFRWVRYPLTFNKKITEETIDTLLLFIHSLKNKEKKVCTKEHVLG